MEENIILIF